MMALQYKLGYYPRREAADALWRLFGLLASRIAISFESTGVTIRVSFKEPQDLDGPSMIVGLFEGSIDTYKETIVSGDEG